MRIGLFIIFSVIVLLSVGSISAQATNQNSIPHWVKAIAGWWSEGKITDSDFQQAVQFLVDSGVIKVHNATGIVASLQLEASQTKTNQTKLLDASNQTVLSPSTFASLSQYSSLWNDGKISDTEYFRVLQNVINIGGFGPFTGQQNDGIPTYEQIVENANPTTVIVEIPMKQENETIPILMGDSIKFVSADHSQEWTILGNLRGASASYADHTKFQAYLISDERYQALVQAKTNDPYSHNMTIPDYESTIKFIGNTGIWDCAYYYVNDHVGKDFKINVTIQTTNMTGIDPQLKESMVSYTNFPDLLNLTVAKFYKMGLVHNPESVSDKQR